MRRLSRFLLVTSALSLPVAASALPTGGAVMTGSASIGNTSNTTTVTQTSQRAVLSWTGFNTTNGQTVTFKDPNSSSITLNRISGGTTTFNGALNSNGQVWFINPEGMIFGSTAKVNVGGLLATTSRVTTNADFMNGVYNFIPSGGVQGATVSNAGSITVANAGLAALVAPHVANTGTITAKAGKITLASGDTYTVDLAGDGLINLAASSAMKQQTLANTGTLNATGGSVVISAAQASAVLDNLINLNGLIEANSLTASNQSGDLEYGAKFTGSTGGNFSLSAYRNVTVDGKTDVRPTSGKLNVTLDSNDTGAAGGGSIYLGDLTVINSNGGNITLGGGANPLTGYAVGDNAPGKDNFGNPLHANGIFLEGAALQAAGGNIVLNGSAPATGNPAGAGIDIASTIDALAQAVTTGNGTVTLNGGKASGSNVGISMTDGTIGSSAGAVRITGTAGAGPNSTGVVLNGNGGSIYSSSGPITITGNAAGSGNDITAGVLLSTNVFTDSGAITITGKTTANSGGSYGIEMINGAITSKTGKVALNASTPEVAGGGGGGLYMYDSAITSTGTGVNAASVTVNGTGSANGVIIGNSAFQTVDGNFYFNSATPSGLPVEINSSTAKSTGKGTFNFSPGALSSN